MVRRIVEIDQKKCNGCGLCASACHEGAIGMVDGKATLLKDDYCDGLGDCLPACPTGAISFVEREAAAYDEAAVQVHMAARKAKQVLEANAAANTSARSEAKPATPAFGGCPGSMSRFLKRPDTAASHASSAATSTGGPGSAASAITHENFSESAACDHSENTPISALCNWPVQIKLAPIRAPYFDGAKLLVAADCTAYAYSRFHQDFIHGKINLDRMSETGQHRLLRKTDRNYPQQRYQEREPLSAWRFHAAEALNRQLKNALQASGKIHSMAGNNHFDRWADFRLISAIPPD